MQISVRSTGPATSSSVLFRQGEIGQPISELKVFTMSDLARLMVGRSHAEVGKGGQ
jgi:hypothetical protein